MNRTSRTEEPYEGDGYNQNPSSLSNGVTANKDLNGAANARELEGVRQSRSIGNAPPNAPDKPSSDPDVRHAGTTPTLANEVAVGQHSGEDAALNATAPLPFRSPSHASRHGSSSNGGDGLNPIRRLKNAILKFGSFIGPGFMISVAYSKPPFIPWHNPTDELMHCLPSRSRELLYRRRRWSNLPLQAVVRRSSRQFVCHLPSESLHQTWHSHWSQPR